MALAAVMAALVSVGASAAPPAERNGPCAEDARRLCPKAKPGSGELRDCMKKHESELSAACRENIAKGKAKVQEAKDACAADVEKFCKGVKPGEGRVVGCLRKNEAQLSEACRATLKNKEKPKHPPKPSQKQAPTQAPAPK
jgi:hypothetical protein